MTEPVAKTHRGFLRGLVVNRVDLVDAGDNPGAAVALWKRKVSKAEPTGGDVHVPTPAGKPKKKTVVGPPNDNDDDDVTKDAPTGMGPHDVDDGTDPMGGGSGRACTACGTEAGPDTAVCPKCGSTQFTTSGGDGPDTDDAAMAGLAKGAPEPYWKRNFTAAQRKEAAASGAAMPDESFPIENGTDLKNAIHLAGNAKDPDAARAHIRSRAKALGLSDQIPDTWKRKEAPVADKESTTIDLEKIADPDVRKAVEAVIAERDAAVAKAAPAEDVEPAEDEVLKSLPEALRKRFEENERKAAAADELAKRIETERDTETFVKRAGEFTKNLPVAADTLGPILRRIAKGESTAADASEVERVLRAADEATNPDLFETIGKGTAADEATPAGLLVAKAQEIRKAKPELTYEEAYDQAIQTPDGQAAYAEIMRPSRTR